MAFCCLQEVTIASVLRESEFARKVHPDVLRLGLAYADGTIKGGNARCAALLSTLRQVIRVCSDGAHRAPAHHDRGFMPSLLLALEEPRLILRPVVQTL
jgi:hypothetical protein